MKATNPKALNPLLQPLRGEGRSNNVNLERIVSLKAGLWVCLFLCIANFPLLAQEAEDLTFDTRHLEAYRLALELKTDEALAQVAEETSVQAVYIASLAEALDLLITEDYSKFGPYEERFHQRIDKSLKGSPRDYQFLQAEIRLQWAFIYLKFGHELDAALQLRQAYQISEFCRERYPEYLPIRKTSGLLQVIIGSVPDKYNWVLSLLSMRGSVSTGLADLESLGQSSSALALESRLLHALVQGFVLAKPEEALVNTKQILQSRPGNRLIRFLAASMALKSAEAEIALGMLENLSDSTRGLPLYYADYLRGEALLQKGDYLKAISSYRWFVQHQPGQNYLKDAYYKIGICYWLNGNENDAYAVFEEARNTGKEVTEADKSASRNLSEPSLPNIKLAKARYATDGGYYREAEKLLSTLKRSELKTVKDQAEYYYRKARLAHKMGRRDAAELYLEVIKITGQENWYFAPNACLQLGYIYQGENKIREAEEYFQRALSYRRHEYKNSIDTKARSALAQLGSI